MTQSTRWAVPRLTIGVALAVLVVDQLTKAWALVALDDGRIIDLIWTLRLNLVFNYGMAFSRGTGIGPLIGMVAIVVSVLLLRASRRAGSTFARVAFGLVVGGAVGNVVDRLFRGDAWMRGAVVDFLDLQWWPVFNVADMGVTVGATMLVAHSLFASERGEAGA
jgi:signal peptidase II